MKNQVSTCVREATNARVSAIPAGSIALILALILLIFYSCVLPTRADIVGLQRVASGLNNPIFVTHAPGDTSRLFIVQRGGARAGCQWHELRRDEQRQRLATLLPPASMMRG